MRPLAFILTLATAAGAPNRPPLPADVLHVEEYLRVSIHPFVSPKDRPESGLRWRLVLDTWAACDELAGDRRQAVFRFMVADGLEESGVTLSNHDGGLGWGPWACRDYEFGGAARRLGKPWTDAESWKRAKANPTVCVWLSVEHLRWALECNGWKPREAAMFHYAGSKGMHDWKKRSRYVPVLLDRYERAWSDHLPFTLAPDPVRAVSSGLPRFGPT